MTDVDIALEAELSTGVWTPLELDIKGEQGVHVKRGIGGTTPLDRVASTGTLHTTMNNAETNIGELLGYYSPEAAGALENWEVGIRERLRLTYESVPYYKFWGKIDGMNPTAGIYGDRIVDVTAVDYMDELAKHKIGMISKQTDKRGDELLDAVVKTMPNAPEGTVYDKGSDVYSYGLHSEKDETTTGMTAIQKIAQSGMDDVFVTGDGYLHYRSRHGRLLNTSVIATFDNTMVKLSPSRVRGTMYNNFSVIYYPVKRDTEPVILYSITNEIVLAPGESTTFTARYTDPLSDGRRVSSDQMITPVAETDFRMAKHSGGYGRHGNFTAYLTVVTKDGTGTAGTFGYNSCEVTLTNTHTKKTGFVYYFNLRGYGVYMYDPVTLTYMDEAKQKKYGDLPFKYDMYYQQDKYVPQDFLAYFKNNYLVPFQNLGGLTFIANTNPTLMLAALQCDVGSRIAIKEELNGLDRECIVQGYALDITAGGIVTCTLDPLVRTDIGGPFGRYGNATYGKIGNTFKFGY